MHCRSETTNSKRRAVGKRLAMRCRFADGVRRIAIQGQSHGLSRIPPTHAPQELPDKLAPLAWEEGPVDAAVIHLGEQEQVEPAAGLLVPLQDQAPGPRVTSATHPFQGGYPIDKLLPFRRI